MEISNIFFGAIFLLGLSQLYGQEKVMFSDPEIVGGFGAIYYQPLQIQDDNVTLVGISGGINFHEFTFGAFVSTSADTWPWQPIENRNEMNLSFGGMWVGYVNNSNNLFHYYGTLRLGLGESIVYNFNLEGHDDTLEDTIDVVQPEVGIEMNLTNFLRLDFGLSYSWVNGFKNTPGYSNDQIGGFHPNLTIKVGRF